MQNCKKRDKNGLDTACACPVTSRPTLGEAVARAERQIESRAFAPCEAARVREICFIIAEIYAMDPMQRVCVSGEMQDVRLMREVFGELRYEHVRMVLDNFANVTALVRNKKAYLRSALYHSVFEFESHYANLVNHALAGEE